MIGSGIFIAPSIMAGYVATPGLWLGLWLRGRRTDAPRRALVRRARGDDAAAPAGSTSSCARRSGRASPSSTAGRSFSSSRRGSTRRSPSRSRSSSAAWACGPARRTSCSRSAASRCRAPSSWPRPSSRVLTCGQRARPARRGARAERVHGAQGGRHRAPGRVGFASGKGSLSHFASPPGGLALGPRGPRSSASSAPSGVAMSKALFAYDAWNTVTFAAEEVREPRAQPAARARRRDRGHHARYMAACAAYLYVLPLDRMAGVAENRVAADVAAAISRAGGGHARLARDPRVDVRLRRTGSSLSGARVLFAMARDGVFFRAAGRVDPAPPDAERRARPAGGMVGRARALGHATTGCSRT